MGKTWMEVTIAFSLVFDLVLEKSSQHQAQSSLHIRPFYVSARRNFRADDVDTDYLP